MSKYQHIYIVTFAVWLVMPSSVFAWGSKGHQIVALIAEAHLNDSTRDKIKAILPKNGTLAKASIWPDEVRKALPQRNPFHYVDVPRGATAYDRERDCPSGIASLRRLQGTDVLI